MQGEGVKLGGKSRKSANWCSFSKGERAQLVFGIVVHQYCSWFGVGAYKKCLSIRHLLIMLMAFITPLIEDPSADTGGESFRQLGGGLVRELHGIVDYSRLILGNVDQIVIDNCSSRKARKKKMCLLNYKILETVLT